MTEFSGHATQLSKEAVEKGFRKILVIGGDGTTNEVVNGIFQQNQVEPKEVTIAMISMGTGGDWVRSMGMSGGWLKTLNIINEGKTMLHDVGIAKFYKAGTPQQRYFLNLAGLGFDGYVTQKVSTKKGLFSSQKIAYTATTLSSLMSYKASIITLEVDDLHEKTEAFSIALGNGKYNGGGMKQLPNSVNDDGLLDMTIIKKMSPLSMFWNFPKIMNGSFINLKTVETYRGKTIKIKSTPDIWLEADGEVLGNGPFEFSVIKQGVSVVAP
jgi:YegS/Rv2252/BmrU family lipid kinase